MNFYHDIIAVKGTVKDVLADAKYFTDVPGHWFVIIADIENSTLAIESGKHDDVNLIAAGSLIAALNVAKAHNTEIPYFFGGDGGTVLVPEEMLAKAVAALNAHKRNSAKNFGLELRVGYLPVDMIRQAGYELKIAKVQIGDGYNKSIVLGDGLKFAEHTIKKHYRENNNPDVLNDLADLNLDGMECRWDKVKPPASELEVVCLLVEATKAADQIIIYRDVLMRLDEIYGEAAKRHPISVNMLQLLFSFNKFRKEMMAKYDRWNPAYIIRSIFRTIIGKFYFRYNFSYKNQKGHDYLSQVVEFSDTLTIDGRINTIISGTPENRVRLLNYLNNQEKKGLLVFGHFVSSESIMTCYVENMKNSHIHFLDGSNGGYTEAAKELKPKLKLLMQDQVFLIPGHKI